MELGSHLPSGNQDGRHDLDHSRQPEIFSFPETAIIACSTDFATDSASSAGTGGCTGTCLDVVPAGTRSTTLGTGRMQKAFIVVNMNAAAGGNFGLKSTTEREITIAHEMGHLIGLGHTEEVAALMHFSIAAKTNLNLHQDDIDGITYLYGRDELGGPLAGLWPFSRSSLTLRTIRGPGDIAYFPCHLVDLGKISKKCPVPVGSTTQRLFISVVPLRPVVLFLFPYIRHASKGSRGNSAQSS